MAYFARVENDVVVEVIAISDRHAPDPAPVNSEASGQDYIQSLGLAGDWKQTSFNGNFRYNYAGVGFTYDADRDAFIPPKPFESWVLDEATCLWVAPIDYPADGGDYTWDEGTGDWLEVTDEAV